MSVLGLFSRFTLIYWVFLLGLFVCFYQIKKIKLYGATVVIGVLGLFGYNFLFYNSIFGGYGHYLGEVYRIDLSFKIIERMLGVLISPSRGMLFYATIFIFVFLTPLFFNKIKTLAFKYQIIYYINVVFTLLIVANAAIYPHWWSGHSFGSRFATEAIPSAVMVTYFIYILYKNKSFKVFFWIIIIFSVFIQIIGTYFYTHTKWNAYPNNIDYNEDRLWSFRDNPISRAFIMGPDFTGFWVLKNNIYKETGKYYNWSEVGCSLKKINETNKLGYTLVELQLNNKSKTDWIHRGYPENFDIELLGDFTNMKSGEISNLFIPTINFPEKVGKNEIVRFQAPIILPDSDPYKIRLYLTQSQGYNFDFCYAEFNIHTQNL